MLPLTLPDKALDAAIRANRAAQLVILNRSVPMPDNDNDRAKERRVMAETVTAFLRVWL